MLKPCYLAAALIGLLAIWLSLPAATLAGTGGVFTAPDGDLPTNLIGHLAYQAPGWHWPLFRAPNLAWPSGESVAMTDSNPLVSIIAKILASLRGQPANLLGVWLAICLLALPISATFAMRGIAKPGRNALPAALTVSVLALLFPEFWFRVIHVNLLGQFVLVVALGIAIRCCGARRPAPFAALFWLGLIAALIHPYFFVFCTIVLAGPTLQAALARQPDARDGIRKLGLAFLLVAGLFLAMNGGPGRGGPGYGLYSLDLLGPFWPQESGLFGRGLPILDSTGYQAEGFNYLGAGIVSLIGLAIVLTKPAGLAALWRHYKGLIMVLLALTALAITPHITAGGHTILPIDCSFLARPLSVLRSSGRAFWVVGFALMIVPVAFLAQRLRPRLFIPAMATALVLQWVDTSPIRHGALAYLAGTGQTPIGFTLPPGTTLFRTVPVCDPDEVMADRYRLVAIRAGARLADSRPAHDPPDDVCARQKQVGLSAPLQPGETRLFLPSVAGMAPAECARGALGALCFRQP